MFHKVRLVCGVLTSLLWLAGPGLSGPPEGRYSGERLLGGTGSTQSSTANVKQFGAGGDGLQDDTAAVQAAIDSLSDAGGIVLFPVGRYRITGQIVLPNDGAATEPRQPPYVFRGAGALFDGRGGPPSGGTILDLRYAQGPKIVSHGLGLLEIHGITLADFGNDDQPFLYTTNTTLHIHDCGFYGTQKGSNARNDAIVLGGTSASGTGGNDPNAPFQGYATVIRDNYFGRIRRMVLGRVFANAVVVSGNTMWSNCGTNLPDGAAIELDGDPDDVTQQVNGGWYVAGNLIEMTWYPYAIRCRESQRNVFIGNSFYDPDVTTIAYYLFEPTGALNYVVAGFHDDNWPFVVDQATSINRSTVIDFHQSRESRFAQPVRFEGKVYVEPGADDPFGPRLVSSAGAELTYQLADDDSMVVRYTPPGGALTPLWQVKDYGAGNIVQELKGTDAGIRNVNGAVRIHSKPGSAAELGDTSGLGIRVDAGALELTSTAVRILSGSGVPTGNAPDGSIYLRSDGAAGSTLYVRESGGWVAK